MALGGAVPTEGGGAAVGGTSGLAGTVRYFHPPGIPSSQAAASAAGPFGSSPTTNPLIAASFPPALHPNRLGLTPNVPTAIYVDRPTVIWPLRQPLGTVRYSAERQPLVTSEPQPNNGTTLSQTIATSCYPFGTGCAFLSGPGQWWVTYVPAAGPAATDTTSLECIQIDCSNPGVLARLMSEGGSGLVGLGSTAGTVNTVDLILTNGSPATLLADANRYRRAAIVQNNSAIPIRVGLGFTPTSGAGAAPQVGMSGFRIGNATQALVLQGDFCWRGDIRVIIENSVAASTVGIIFTEWSF